MSIHGRGVQPMPTEIFQELLGLMPCMYDIQVQTARNITRLSAAAFKRARERTGTGKQWPFVSVKESSYMLNWAQIRERRALAIVTASDFMKRILVKVEGAAHLMRVWNMPRGARMALEAIPFPVVEIDGQEVSDTEPRDETLIRTDLSPEQKEKILHLLIDIPIHDITRILNISHHSLQSMRQKLGLEIWPLESIRRCTYHLSAAYVEQQRIQATAAFPENSVERSVLLSAQSCLDAKKEVNDICRKAKRARLERDTFALTEQVETVELLWTGTPQEEESLQPTKQETQEDDLLIEDPPSCDMDDDDFKEWFQSILGDTENDEQEQRFWKEDSAELSAEERAYWDSLIDYSPDHLTAQAP
jgi:hypothetical protein